MINKVIADFTVNCTRFQVIEHNNGEDGYTVFTRVLSDWDLDNADCFNSKEDAIARFLFLTNRILLEVH